MKRIISMLFIIALFSSCLRTEVRIISKIERECNIHFDNYTDALGGKIYRYKFTGENSIFTCKDRMKGIIDKEVNALPYEVKERAPYYTGELWDFYKWETPKIIVSLSILYSGGEAKSIEIFIDNK